MVALALVETVAVDNSEQWRLPIRFCLNCGGFWLDWLSHAWRCQTCGELQVPAKWTCPWCLANFAADVIAVHRERCGPVKYDKETRRRMAAQERGWLAAARPGESDWESAHTRLPYREAG